MSGMTSSAARLRRTTGIVGSAIIDAKLTPDLQLAVLTFPPNGSAAGSEGSPVPRVIWVWVERGAAQAVAWRVDEKQPSPGDSGAVGVFPGLVVLILQIQLFQD